jgi:hypothetical protein
MAMADGRTILGSWNDAPGGSEQSVAVLGLDAADLSHNWRRCSLSADFLARYYSYYFPYREKATDRISRDAAENTISYILNELIENTAKYSDAAETWVEVVVRLRENDVLFQVSNHVTEKRAGEFTRIVSDLLGGNAEELYVAQLEKNTGSSGLGYLTMINDYGVSLGFMVKKNADDVFTVSVQASMKWKEA